MILTIFKKDLKLFFTDKKGMGLTFLMPILLISLFAFAFGGTGNGGESKPLEVLVADMDQTEDSRSVIASIDSLKGVVLVPSTITEGTDLVLKGKYVAVLIFEKGFQDSIASGNELAMELKYDAAREIEIGMLQGILMQNLMGSVGKKVIRSKMNTYMDTEFFDLEEDIKEKIFNDMDNENSEMNATMTGGMDLKMTSVIKEENEEKNVGLIQAVAGTAIMMLLFTIAGIGGGLLDEKEAGTLKRLLYSPIKPTDILFGKMLSALVISILQLVVMFGFAGLAFGLPIFTDVVSLLLMILCTAFAVSGFGIFLVSIAKTRQQLQGFSTIIIMIMSAIGGSMVPLFIMPAIMQKIAVVSVNYWGIQGFFDIFWRELPLLEILPKMGVLMTFGLVLSVISVRLFKKKLFQLA